MEEARTGARDVPVERRASQLELQLEQVQLTLEQLRQTQGSLHQMETRLGDMTRECAEILDRWAKNDERHAAAVVELHGRLSEWNDVERRLLNESATRVHQFERSLEHEWHALRQKHEAPLQQIEAQGARIAETCLAAVQQALTGFDKAEARLAALEANVQREMGQLAAEVRGALTELREAQPLGGRQPWSLDNVVRLHNELRGEDQAVDPSSTAASATGTLGLAPAPLRTPRVLAAEPARAATPAGDPGAEAGSSGADSVERRAWRIVPLAGTLVVALAAGAYGLYLHGRVSEGLRQAAARAEAAERDAAASRIEAREQIAAARQAADERLASAERAASLAQAFSAIVAAPDAKRFDLTGTGRPDLQVLWSRTRGVAVTTGPLPPPPEGYVYQLWFTTREVPASVGLLEPPATGPLNAVFPWPANLLRVVTGAFVTTEPSGGSSQPTTPPWVSTRTPPPPAHRGATSGTGT